MFPFATAHFSLALAWSEFNMTTLAAATSVANASAKLMTAEAEAATTRQQVFGVGPNTQPLWPEPAIAPYLDAMRLALSVTEASAAFWRQAMDQFDPAGQATGKSLSWPGYRAASVVPANDSTPLPLWWTAFWGLPLGPERPQRTEPAQSPVRLVLH